MKYSIGYQLPDEYDSTYNLCKDYRESISNVYFAYANQPSGRMPLCENDSQSIKEVSDYQLEELKEICKLGISVTLLLNANCYGEKATSKELAENSIELLRLLIRELNICDVTTTSPFIAKAIKNEFAEDIKIRASVNMKVDNILTMKQLGRYFDGFYIRKELNRSLSEIEKLKNWCDSNGKTLHILANSGCISYCGFQTFHDNLVAHHGYMQEIGEGEKFPSPCWEYLNSLDYREALAAILSSNFIRPEDVKNYEPYFSEMKLATRMHSVPRKVISAYARERFTGNIMDLTEPSYSTLFRGKVLDNTLFPNDWFGVTSKCSKNCDQCRYCAEVLNKIMCSY